MSHVRPMTSRERAVLDALLAVVTDDMDDLRSQAETALVWGGCSCGCPSIDFVTGPSGGMSLLANAEVLGSETGDGLFLYAVAAPGGGRMLGGIEWVGNGECTPAELPAPEDLVITSTTP